MCKTKTKTKVKTIAYQYTLHSESVMYCTCFHIRKTLRMYFQNSLFYNVTLYWVFAFLFVA